MTTASFILLGSALCIFIFGFMTARARKAERERIAQLRQQMVGRSTVKIGPRSSTRGMPPMVPTNITPGSWISSWKSTGLPQDPEALKEIKELFEAAASSKGGMMGDPAFQGWMDAINTALEEAEATEEERQRREKEDARMEVCPECEQPFNVKDDYICPDCRAKVG